MANQRYEQYYYRFGSPDNIEKNDIPLQVNCCGVAYVPKKYVGGYPHGRKDFYLIYLLDGVMEGNVDGRPVSLEKSDLICVSAKTSCTFNSVEPMTEPIRYYWIHFTGSDAAKVVIDCGLETNKVYRIKTREEIFNHFEKLFSEFRLRLKSKTFDYATSLELQYIFFLLGKSADTAENTAKLDLSIKYIHTHVSSALSVEELAAMEYLAVSRYREVFKKITGVSPSEYITRLRLARAKELLSQGEFGISEISELVGYKDRLYFQRIFKKYENLTPGEYVKKC